MVYYSSAKVGLSNGVRAMPLTRRQFELGINEEAEDWMRQAYQSLEQHRDLAYSAKELAEDILGDAAASYNKSNKLERALDVLAEIGAVDKGKVDGTDYYAYLQDFDTGTWKSAKLTPPPPTPARSNF